MGRKRFVTNTVKLLVVGSVVMGVSGCVGASFSCPVLIEYAQSEQTRVEQELRGMGPDDFTPVMIDDYGKLRAQCRG